MTSILIMEKNLCDQAQLQHKVTLPKVILKTLSTVLYYRKNGYNMLKITFSIMKSSITMRSNNSFFENTGKFDKVISNKCNI